MHVCNLNHRTVFSNSRVLPWGQSSVELPKLAKDLPREFGVGAPLSQRAAGCGWRCRWSPSGAQRCGERLQPCLECCHQRCPVSAPEQFWLRFTKFVESAARCIQIFRRETRLRRLQNLSGHSLGGRWPVLTTGHQDTSATSSGILAPPHGNRRKPVRDFVTVQWMWLMTLILDI